MLSLRKWKVHNWNAKQTPPGEPSPPEYLPAIFINLYHINRWWTWTSQMPFQCYLLTMQEEIWGKRVHQQLWERRWEGHKLNVRKFESSQPPKCQVWKIMTCQIFHRTLSLLFGAWLKLMSLRRAPLCANKRWGRLMHRCPSCITASHAWMVILPIKSRTGQQSSCTGCLNEHTSSPAECLMPEQLVCQPDKMSHTLQWTEVLRWY